MSLLPTELPNAAHDGADPNWLLSTAVQASAALVGIVGAFLISRLVSLATERNSLLRQRASATVAHTLARKRASAAHEDRIDLAKRVLEDWALDSIVAQLPTVSAESIAEDNCPRGTDPSELLGFASELIAHAVRLRADVIRAVGDSGIPTSVAELEEDFDIQIEDWEERIVDLLLENLHHPVVSSDDFYHATPLRIERVQSNSLVERYESALERERAASAEEDVASAILALAETSLRAIVYPTEMKNALWVLTAFALMGIVYPSVWLAVGAERLGPTTRATIVGAFLLGVAGLVVYLWLTVLTLTRSDAADAVAEDRVRDERGTPAGPDSS